MVPSLVFILHFHELGLMGKRLEEASALLLETLQISSEADKTASHALSEK